MFGKGLAKGMRITLGAFFSKKIVQRYPEVMPDLAPRTRSSMFLDVPKCISCGICSNACPNNVITISSAKDETTNKKVLKEYKMNTGRCLFCGMCVEACPSKCLHTTSDFENAVYTRDELTWDMMKKYDDAVAKGSYVPEVAKEEVKDNG